MLLVLAAFAPSGWTSTSQNVYGAQVEGMRREQHHTSDLGPYQTLGFLWTLPEDTTNRTGLGCVAAASIV